MKERSDLNYDLNKLVNIIKSRGLVLVNNVFKIKSCEILGKFCLAIFPRTSLLTGTLLVTVISKSWELRNLLIEL